LFVAAELFALRDGQERLAATAGAVLTQAPDQGGNRPPPSSFTRIKETNMTIDTDERAAVIRDFHNAVNMTPAELEEWLGTEESREVGWKGEDGHGTGESVGHKSGTRIVELLRSKDGDLGEDDLAHMKKVIGYVHRHLAQKPAHPEGSRWAASLKNWGHDPARS
jgi:hypothetical protein